MGFLGDTRTIHNLEFGSHYNAKMEIRCLRNKGHVSIHSIGFHPQWSVRGHYRDQYPRGQFNSEEETQTRVGGLELQGNVILGGAPSEQESGARYQTRQHLQCQHQQYKMQLLLGEDVDEVEMRSLLRWLR